MKEATKQREKTCPVCEKQYPEEDNYCGDDGSILVRALGGKHHLGSAGTPITADDLNVEPDGVLQN
jgi:hypothetical protein